MSHSDPGTQTETATAGSSSEGLSDLLVTQQVSYRQLLYLRFLRNRLAVAGFWILAILYVVALGAEFFAPYDKITRFGDILAPPRLPRFVDADGRFHLRPFVYAYEKGRDPETLRRTYVADTTERYPLGLFVRGDEYEFLFIQSNVHLFGVEGAEVFLLGTDNQGRDLFSRVIYGARLSTTIGLCGVAISLVLGIIIGMISGYLGGIVDQAIQRGIEVLLSFPSIPLWLALSALLPLDWSPRRIFFFITIILSILNWGSLARIVRGLTLSVKNEEYVLSARMGGGGRWWIIRRHLFPANLSYAIVAATLSVPEMILGETALSFLGLGLRPPAVSWGVLLQASQKVSVLGVAPWLVSPVAFVIVTVLAFNFVGDGLRDAVDPHSRF